MTDAKRARFEDLKSRFGPETARRVVDEEYKDQLDLEDHEGVRKLKQWREEKNEQRRLEQEQRDKERHEQQRARGVEEMQALEKHYHEKFLRSGGAEGEWKDAWPDIRRKVLVERTLEGESYYNAANSVF